MYDTAAYIRVSTDSDAQEHSLAQQASYYRNLIMSKDNWRFAGIYSDDGISGTGKEKRTGFRNLIEDCCNGKINLVLSKSITRFARNVQECVTVLRTLKKNNVYVVFEKEGIDTRRDDSEMIITLLASMAQEESISISQDMRWSYQYRMKSGRFITCKPPLGYRLINGALEINEEEAPVVKKIFREALRGKSPGEISDELRIDGVTLSDHGIRYILKNEKYVGNVLLQKRYSTNTLPFAEVFNHGERDMYFIENCIPPLISKEDFYSVQALQAERTGMFFVPKGEPSFFEGKLICNHCGKTYRKTKVRGTTYWVCRTHHKNAGACPSKRISELSLKYAFVNLYNKLRFGIDHILSTMVYDLNKVKELSEIWQNIQKLNEQISSLQEQNRLLYDLERKGGICSALSIQKRQIISGRINEMRSQIKTLKSRNHLNDVIVSTEELINILRNAPTSISAFDERLYSQIVTNVYIDGQCIKFHLINTLELTEYVSVRRK